MESSLLKIRHSAAHILAAAVQRLFPSVKFDIGPATDDGFYYDFDLDHKFTTDDFLKIETEMQHLIDQNQTFESQIISRAEAHKLFSDRRQIYKLSRLDDIPEGEAVTIYRNGDFVDLCRGPHVQNSSEVKAFKLLSIAGAYYRGNEKNQQMQRIYGTAFDSKEALETHLVQLEEAKKRDHRKLGKELELFMIDDAVGQGLILWLPKGNIIRTELQKFISSELEKLGYMLVSTPHIAKLGLFRTSGHFPYYKDAQYPPIAERATLESNRNLTCAELVSGLENGLLDGFLLKPMNCPGHIKIYTSKARSYRDLPIKLAEFGTVYRWEQSGELSGMTRVRGFTQDDAHIFCTEEQLSDEILECLDLVKMIFSTLGITDFRVRVGLRDPNSEKYIGNDESWTKAEGALRKAAEELGVPYSLETGEAAFYGPKIDFVIKDVIGREWQLGTVQVDYNLPERFSINYVGSDNKPHRPVMIHRAPFGSMERFCGLLIEHFGGDFPTWLSPEQVRLLPLSDHNVDYVRDVLERMRRVNIRTSIDASSEKLGAKVRKAEMEKIPYIFVIGDKENDNRSVSIRSRRDKTLEDTYPVDQAIDLVLTEIQTKHLFLKEFQVQGMRSPGGDSKGEEPLAYPESFVL
ncbi:MAG: threonine--tRNA ligase [Puniceicoccales bacterium]|jgi:threonyl-tRNA synthetase|nr:threonine--tRNA ligase [Puniceicoccales bacterium]